MTARTRKPLIPEQTMRDCIRGHYRAYLHMDYDESTARAQSFVGEALEAEYTRVMEWNNKGYTHAIDPDFYNRLMAINHCIKLLQDDKNKIVGEYEKAHDLAHDQFQTAVARELTRRVQLETEVPHA